MVTANVVTRFAPSPTGFVHLGGARTALFNWLYAKRHNGKFLLRIEDTDRERFVDGAVDQLKLALRTLGLNWDHGPDVGGPAGSYVQSERLALYRFHCDEMLKAGHFYKCWCTKSHLENARKEFENNGGGQASGYDRRCRYLTPEKRAELEASGEPFVVRVASPLNGETVVNDLIRGLTVFPNKTIVDAVMFKSDGFPTYHLASVVDDHDMATTHVMRGDEWLPSTPLHLHLYSLFGWTAPEFVHLAPVLGKDGKKLSKRNSDASLNWYLDQGYLPEALLNLLALTGWNPGDEREFMTVDEIAASFTLERLHKTGAVFDKDKLDHMNKRYITNLPCADFVDRVIPHLVKAKVFVGEPSADDLVKLALFAPLVQTRVSKLDEAAPYLHWMFNEPSPDAATLLGKNGTVDSTKAALSAVIDAIGAMPVLSTDEVGALLKGMSVDGIKARDIMAAARAAITGTVFSLPLFETVAIFGREKTLTRLRRAIDSLT